MRILIAEDEPISREGLRQLVPTDLYEQIDLASNGLEALELARKHLPDVLLCDIRMPRMDGLQLSSLLREQAPDLRIVFISAYADKSYFKGAIAVQADAYLEKPIDEKELVGWLTRFAQEHQRAERLRSDRDEVERQAEQFTRQQLLWTLLRRDRPQEHMTQLDARLTEEVMHAPAFLPISVQLRLDDSAGDPFRMAADPRVSAAFRELLGERSLITAISAAQLAVVLYGAELPSPTALCASLEQGIARAALFPPADVAVCVGPLCQDIDQLPRVYHEAHEQAMWMSFCASGPLCRTAHARISVPSCEERFRTLLQAQDIDAARDLLAGYTRTIASLACADIEEVRRRFEQLLAICLQAADHTEAERLSIRSAFIRLRTLPELERFLQVRIGQLMPPMSMVPGTS